MYTWSLLKKCISSVLTTEENIYIYKTMWGDGYVNLIVAIISQYVHTSKHHIVYLNYAQILFVNHMSIKLIKVKFNKLENRRKENNNMLSERRQMQMTTHCMWFHFYEMFRKYKFIQAGSKLVGAWSWEWS